MKYDLDAVRDCAVEGASLLEAIIYVDSNALASLDACIGFIHACISAGRHTEEEIMFFWSRVGSIYDPRICLWLLEKFEGDDPSNDLWMRGSNGEYYLLTPNLGCLA